MKLYYSPNLNPRVAVAVARYLKSELEFIRASPRAPGHEDGFRPINPNTLVPVLVEPTRTYWETDAIACRLSALAGSEFWRTDDTMPDMIMWISWATHHLNSAASVFYWENIIRPTFSNIEPPPAVMEEAMANFRRFAGTLDAYLEGRDWLLGDKISYADFRVATALPFADAAGLPVAEFPHVQRWHQQLWVIDAWRDPFAGLT